MHLPTAAQLRFMQHRDATSSTRGASAFPDAVFVYHRETLGTWRWLVDGGATVFAEDFFASATGPRLRDGEPAATMHD